MVLIELSTDVLFMLIILQKRDIGELNPKTVRRRGVIWLIKSSLRHSPALILNSMHKSNHVCISVDSF